MKVNQIMLREYKIILKAFAKTDGQTPTSAELVFSVCCTEIKDEGIPRVLKLQKAWIFYILNFMLFNYIRI